MTYIIGKLPSFGGGGSSGGSSSKWSGEPNRDESEIVVRGGPEAKKDDTNGLRGTDWLALCALKVLKDFGDVQGREAYVMSALMQKRADASKLTSQHNDDLRLLKNDYINGLVNRAKQKLGIGTTISYTPPPVTPISPGGDNVLPTDIVPATEEYYVEEGMSTGTKIALGVGGVVGAVILAKKFKLF